MTPGTISGTAVSVTWVIGKALCGSLRPHPHAGVEPEQHQVGDKRADQRQDGDGMAVAGLVLGYAQLALCVLAMFLLIAVLFLITGKRSDMITLRLAAG